MSPWESDWALMLGFGWIIGSVLLLMWLGWSIDDMKVRLGQRLPKNQRPYNDYY